MKKLAVLPLLAMALSACGQPATSSATSGDRARSIDEPGGELLGPQRPKSPSSILPSVEAIDIATGDRIDIATLIPASKPLLMWFWAPHCPVCNREAPGVKRFADEHAEALTVIGLGTQDDLDLARSFVARNEIGFRMLWDPSFESWRALGVPGQPSSLLLDPQGRPLGSWVGPFDEAEVVGLI